MNYQPREGVDYLTDLYQIAAVPPDADTDAIRQALNDRSLAYHPDRLSGLAPEFQLKGERMIRLLNRARAILLEPDKRGEYDAILGAWKGPVSTDGTPVINMNDALLAELATRTPDEIETVFTAQRDQAASMVRHDPRQQAMLGRMLASAEGEEAVEVRAAYDVALLAEDVVLAIEEADRGRLVGLPDRTRHDTALGHAEKVRLALAEARNTLAEDRRQRALGGVGTKLALLAGEATVVTESDDAVSTYADLPHYFDDQSQKVADLAAKREALLKERLRIFEPTYPIAEAQTEAHPNFVIGMTGDESQGDYTWLAFSFDEATVDLSNSDVPQDVLQLLTAGHFDQVYSKGFNILTFATKEQIDLETLLEEAYNKHLHKYFPDAFSPPAAPQG